MNQNPSPSPSPNPGTLVVIHCHGGVEPILDRHEPFWAGHGCDYIFVCPQDKPIWGRPHFSIGGEGHSGMVSINRFRSTWRLLEKFDSYDRFAIFEYDSLCLCTELPAIPDGGGMIANMKVEHNPSQLFRSRYYWHAPWIIDAQSLHRLNQVMGFLRPDLEGGFFDRYLGLALQQYKIPTHPLGALGYSQNTIEASHQQECAEAILLGAVALHGVKTEECLRMALTNRENYARSKVVSDNMSTLRHQA